ncbi:MAG: hypothetical protein LBF27_05695 [Sphingobacterium sp.]|jgi:hypothetical protein|nr:hypothetical protein [Sphingobacterium sp.]
MKYITKLLLCLFIIINWTTSCKAQNTKQWKNGNLKVGSVNYSVRTRDNSTAILISGRDVSHRTWNIARNNPKKDVIPKSELKLNVSELTKLKNEILGNNTTITVRFYFDTDEKLMGLEYDLWKESNITLDQFKRFDQEIRKIVKGSLIRSFDYSTYLPYVVRSVVLQ